MKCIICLEEREPSDEHIFSDALGGSLRTKRVCKSCNSFMGSYDDGPLINHPMVAMKRAQLGIRSASGHLPDVFASVFGVGVLASDLEQKVTMSLKGSDHRPEPRLIYKRTQSVSPDGSDVVTIVIDPKDAASIPKIIKREREKAGLPPLSAEELDAETSKAVEATGTLEDSTVNFKFPIDLIHYKRGLIKIAYELAWLWLGDSYLDDPTAATFRSILLAPPGLSEPQVDMRGRIELERVQAFQLWNQYPDYHLAFAIRSGGKIVLSLCIFDVMSAVIGVSTAPHRYPTFGLGDSIGEFIEVNPVARTHRRTTFAVEAQRLTESAAPLHSIE